MLGSSGDKEKHHIIENNHFNNCFSRSIYSRYTQDLQLNQNTISNSLNYHQGIVVSFLSGNVSISGNDIRLLAGGYYGMSIYASNGTALLPIQVNNNYILARNSSSATLGIAQEACNYVKYNYNTVRKIVLGNLPFLLSDTVGFIRKLPTQLIESFKSTLDETREADLLLHVVDISHHNFEEQYGTVRQTLDEIGAGNKPVIVVFNKIDAYRPADRHEDDLEEKRVDQYTLEELKETWMARME